MQDTLEAQLSALLPDGALRSTQVHIKTKSELNSLFGNSSHQGLIAEINPQGPRKVAELEPLNLLIVLDQVVDPQNVGSIFRLAACLGSTGVVICKNNAAQVTSAARRASSGATEFVPFSVVTNLVSAINTFKQAGFWVYASALDSSAESLYSQEFPEKAVFVLGNESDGIRSLVKKTCDVVVKIPQASSLDSLNVAQAACVLSYEFIRQAHEKQR